MAENERIKELELENYELRERLNQCGTYANLMKSYLEDTEQKIADMFNQMYARLERDNAETDRQAT